MISGVGLLNDSGIEQFRDWLRAEKSGSAAPPPTHLLTDPSTTEPLVPAVQIELEPFGRPFESRYEFGLYLSEKLAVCSKTTISRQAALWNWLTLFYIDQLAPPRSNGGRVLVDLEVYLLDHAFRHDSYYRHAVRASWLAATEHAESSKVLLIPAGRPPSGVGTLAHRGELFEQLAARQQVMGSKTVIAGACRLYLDAVSGRPRRGAGGGAGGSPRRLGLVLQQLELTYDLTACSVDQFLSLLPKEFNRWR
jgi:hypothetical protein